MAQKSKAYRAAAEKIEADKYYTPTEAVALAKETGSAKFDSTVEVALKLAVDPRKADQMVRGTVILPHGTGKTARVIVFATGPAAEAALAAGADEVGGDELIEKVAGGYTAFDSAVSTPELMGKVGRLGKVLGPRGLMPNPKVGTVTMNVGQAVKDAKGGAVEFRVEKAGIVHAGVGKASFDEAVRLVKQNATAKFDESIEIAVNLGVDPRHADQQVRGVVNLPSGTGRDVRVAVIANDAKAAEAQAAGADVVGAEDLVERIQGGFMDFDRVIATPDMMALVGRLGKVLGPRGLMPNPKVGTVTPNVGQAVKDAKGGAVEFRVEKAGIVHAGIGKASFTEDALAANVRAMVEALNRAKPTGAKGTYVKKISLSSTMGPGVKIDPASLTA